MSNGFIDWLQTVCDRIADQEEQGKALIESGDTAGYRAIMRKKAELLASLDKEGGVHLAALPAALRERARAGLRNFASGAANALSIDSVFYMVGSAVSGRSQARRTQQSGALSGRIEGRALSRRPLFSKRDERRDRASGAVFPASPGVLRPNPVRRHRPGIESPTGGRVRRPQTIAPQAHEPAPRSALPACGARLQIVFPDRRYRPT